MLKKKTKVEFFEPFFFFKKKNALSRIFGKKGSILWVKFKKSGFNSLSNVEKKGSISMSFVEEKDSILWVMLKRRVQFFEIFLKKNVNHVQKGFNYLTHFPKVNSISQIKNRVQLFKSYWKFLILWVILKKFYWKMFNSSSHILKRVQFFE